MARASKPRRSTNLWQLSFLRLRCVATYLIRLPAKGAHNGLGVMLDNSKQDTRQPIWYMPTLFPILHCTGVETRAASKFLTAQFHPFAQRQDVLRNGIVDYPARKRLFTAHRRKNLAQCRFHFKSQLSPLGHHLFSSSLEILDCGDQPRAHLSVAELMQTTVETTVTELTR